MLYHEGCPGSQIRPALAAVVDHVAGGQGQVPVTDMDRKILQSLLLQHDLHRTDHAALVVRTRDPVEAAVVFGGLIGEEDQREEVRYAFLPDGFLNKCSQFLLRSVRRSHRTAHLGSGHISADRSPGMLPYIGKCMLRVIRICAPASVAGILVKIKIPSAHLVQSVPQDQVLHKVFQKGFPFPSRRKPDRIFLMEHGSVGRSDCHIRPASEVKINADMVLYQHVQHGIDRIVIVDADGPSVCDPEVLRKDRPDPRMCDMQFSDRVQKMVLHIGPGEGGHGADVHNMPEGLAAPLRRGGIHNDLSSLFLCGALRHKLSCNFSAKRQLLLLLFLAPCLFLLAVRIGGHPVILTEQSREGRRIGKTAVCRDPGDVLICIAHLADCVGQPDLADIIREIDPCLFLKEAGQCGGGYVHLLRQLAERDRIPVMAVHICDHLPELPVIRHTPALRIFIGAVPAVQKKDVHQSEEVTVDPALPVVHLPGLQPDHLVEQGADILIYGPVLPDGIQKEDASAVRRELQEGPVGDAENAQDPIRSIAVRLHRIDQDHVPLFHGVLLLRHREAAGSAHHIEDFDGGMRMLLFLRVFSDLYIKLPVISHIPSP